jgi:hypothetical protein
MPSPRSTASTQAPRYLGGRASMTAPPLFFSTNRFLQCTTTISLLATNKTIPILIPIPARLGSARMDWLARWRLPGSRREISPSPSLPRYGCGQCSVLNANKNSRSQPRDAQGHSPNEKDTTHTPATHLHLSFCPLAPFRWRGFCDSCLLLRGKRWLLAA